MSNMLNANNNTFSSTLMNQNVDEISMTDLFSTLVDGKWIVISITIIFLCIGIAKAILDEPVYSADVIFQVNEKSQGLLGHELSLAESNSEISIQAEIEFIKSRKILGEVVENLGLDIIVKPNYFPIVGKVAAERFQKNNHDDSVSKSLFGLSSYAWGGEFIKVDTFSVPSNWIDREFQLLGDNRGNFQLIYRNQIILDGRVGKLTSKQLGHNQQPLTILVSQLKSLPGTTFSVMKQSKAAAIYQLREVLSISEKGPNTRIMGLTVESHSPDSAAKISNEIANTYIQQNVELKSLGVQKNLEFLNKHLPIMKNQLDAASNSLNEYRYSRGSVNLVTETKNLLHGAVELKTQISLLHLQRDELRQRFTDSHPSVKVIDRQLARLQEQTRSHDKMIKMLPETEQVILGLSEEVKVSSRLYSVLLSNAKMLRVSMLAPSGGAMVIDYAVKPDQAIRPQKLLIIGGALILGLMLGLAVVFIRRILNPGVKDPALIERELNMPVCATVLFSKKQRILNNRFDKNYKSVKKIPSLLALFEKDGQVIEGLRGLCASLHFSLLEGKNNTLLISGPSAGIGKTFVSTNLATVMAETGKKILLIDADMRSGYMHKIFGVSKENGLSRIILNTVTVKEAIHKIPLVDIDFIPAGEIHHNPAELLLNENFAVFLNDISKQYDLVIIDSPPVLAVSDALIISRMVKAVYLVVKSGEHPMGELMESVIKLSDAGAKVEGIVFNAVPESYPRYVYGSRKTYQGNFKRFFK